MITEEQQEWPHFYKKPVRANDKQGWELNAGQSKSRANALTTAHTACSSGPAQLD